MEENVPVVANVGSASSCASAEVEITVILMNSKKDVLMMKVDPSRDKVYIYIYAVPLNSSPQISPLQKINTDANNITTLISCRR